MSRSHVLLAAALCALAATVVAAVPAEGATPLSARTPEKPTITAVSRTAGTVTVTVRTHPSVAYREITVYAVVRRPKYGTMLITLAQARTGARGRAHPHITVPGRPDLMLEARMSGTTDHREQLSAPVSVQVR